MICIWFVRTVSGPVLASLDTTLTNQINSISSKEVLLIFCKCIVKKMCKVERDDIDENIDI